MNNTIEDQIMKEVEANESENYGMLCVDDTGYVDGFSGGMGGIMEEVLSGESFIQYRGL